MTDSHAPVLPATIGRVFRSEPEYGASLLFGSTVRALAAQEIALLEAAANRADDWSLVRVAPGFDPAYVERVRFRGRVVIGATGLPIERVAGFAIRSGLLDSSIADAEIGDGVLIERVGLVHRFVVDTGARVTCTAAITHTPGTSFSNGRVLDLVCSPGGRRVALRADLSFSEAARAAGLPGQSPAVPAERAETAWRSTYGYIGSDATVDACGRIHSSWIGPSAEVRNVTTLENSTLLSDPDRVTRVLDGSIVQESLVQWGCRVSGGAFVHHSLLCEGSVVERHGIVQGSILGPDSVVAEGEVSKSLVGPLVGFHHQALLVSAYWPEGRGNVGYGANVGSNHTGKAPDQEIRPGEGAFFGLGVNIKFPSDFSRAPYLLIATGVDTLPQRITMPFSLLTVPTHPVAGMSSAVQEIRPGWMLRENPYALFRNELKFAARQRARAGRVDTRVFRPETMEEVARALTELESAADRPWYTDRHLPGIGKNVLTDEARREGAAAYRSSLRRYGLREAFECLTAGESLTWTEHSGSDRWRQARRFLSNVSSERDPVGLVRLHVAETWAWAEEVAACKRRDDERGPRIIEDYAAVHPPAAEDEVVRRAFAISAETRAAAEALLTRMRLV